MKDLSESINLWIFVWFIKKKDFVNQTTLVVLYVYVQAWGKHNRTVICIALIQDHNSGKI